MGGKQDNAFFFFFNFQTAHFQCLAKFRVSAINYNAYAAVRVR